MPAVALVVPRQVHGTRICTVTGPAPTRPEADGLLTQTEGVAVGITTADCVPLLLLAPAVRVAVAVHAGWRGTLAGVVPKAVGAAASLGAIPEAQLCAAIGPAIGACCYEVGPEVRAAFEKRYGRRFAGPAFTTTGMRPRLDLRLFVRRQLEAAGISPSAIHVLGPCTACDRAYASYRRDGPRAARQLSFVGWL